MGEERRTGSTPRSNSKKVLQAREEDISGLNNTLAVVVQERDVLRLRRHICKAVGRLDLTTTR